MTNAQAIALPKSAIVQHKSGKLYRVYEVVTQPSCTGKATGRYAFTPTRGECLIEHPDADPALDAEFGIDASWFTGNPLPTARLIVVGRRDGRDFGPIRGLDAAACEAVL